LLPPVALWTSVRVSDSLEQGVSFYMAELLRLKEIHSAAEAAHAAGQPFCYLLDEILQGTNSAERQIAARHIIAQLIELGAIGAVSTHDLHLAESSDLAAKAVAVHFSDSVTDTSDGPSMAFDYILRPGLATSTNALRLMELVGFDVPVADGHPSPVPSRSVASS
jgi:DNA mismatch repair ATPase MutS